MDDNDGDALLGHSDEADAQWAGRRAELTWNVAGAQAVAGLVFATGSLIGLRSGEILAQAVLSHSHDFRGFAAAPAIAAVVAVLGGWLGRRDLRTSTPSWARPLAAAAVIVAGVSTVINVAAFIGLVSVSQGGGIVGP